MNCASCNKCACSASVMNQSLSKDLMNMCSNEQMGCNASDCRIITRQFDIYIYIYIYIYIPHALTFIGSLFSVRSAIMGFK
jgi:hypothetical protein